MPFNVNISEIISNQKIKTIVFVWHCLGFIIDQLQRQIFPRPQISFNYLQYNNLGG